MHPVDMPRRTNRFAGLWGPRSTRTSVSPRGDRALRSFVREQLRRNPAINLSELTLAAEEWNQKRKKASRVSVNERAVRVAARGLKNFPGSLTTTSGPKATPRPKGEPRTVTHHPAPKRPGRNARKRALRAFVREQIESDPSISLAELTQLANDQDERDRGFGNHQVGEDAVRNAARA
jgi:hypothetical protein